MKKSLWLKKLSKKNKRRSRLRRVLNKSSLRLSSPSRMLSSKQLKERKLQRLLRRRLFKMLLLPNKPLNKKQLRMLLI